MTRQQIVEALHAGANALEAWARAQKVQPAEAVAILRHLRDAIERGQEAPLGIYVVTSGDSMYWDGRPVLILSLEGRG